MNDDGPVGRYLWPFLASLAGSVTALSFRPFKTLGKWEIMLALFVGASFAFFVAPWVVYITFGHGPIDTRVAGAIFYLLASGSNILIPFMIKKLGVNIGYRGPEDTP